MNARVCCAGQKVRNDISACHMFKRKLLDGGRGRKRVEGGEESEQRERKTVETRMKKVSELEMEWSSKGRWRDEGRKAGGGAV